jgi:hypothetical protein
LAARSRAETRPRAVWLAARLSIATRGARDHRLNRWSKPREQEPSSRTASTLDRTHPSRARIRISAPACSPHRAV